MAENKVSNSVSGESDTLKVRRQAGRRKRGGYFKCSPDAPKPLRTAVKRRVAFGEADFMGIAWHGRYASYFEDASITLGRKSGLSFPEFRDSNLRVPIVQFHIDYFRPLFMEEEFTVEAALIWNEGARVNTEFTLIKEDGSIAATGYMVQMFINGDTGMPYMAAPELLEKCRKRWKAGEFSCIQ